MEEIRVLIRGFCPICNRTIMNEKKTAYNDYGMEFFVKFSDGSKANFAICKECFKNLTQEQVDKILQRQLVNYGAEIQSQMVWFYKIAIHLKVAKWSENKKEL